MSKIITTSQLQKNIGKIDEYVSNSFAIIVNRGKPEAVLLPYFEDNDEMVLEYLEDYEMMKNKKILKERYKKSSQSGPSSLFV
ncbi:type II toxin-antitoxin system Phd/YefM family antitoxin [Candidatus Gracilibacteria bacterium]|nr:type II toxin-antitoxin system Phd/YefM family antitoxin [Candidatus Gracilibacteria bacterium]